MRSRPKVQVHLRPGVITPGSTFETIVRLDSRRELVVNAVSAQFTGVAVAFWAGQFQPPARIVDLVGVDKPKKLPAGPYEMRVRFAVPNGAPPSYEGTTLRVAYTVKIHVNIPWWIDREAEYTVPIVGAPVRAGDARPVAAVWDRPDDVYAECAIDRVAVAPGGVLTGRVAFSRTRESALGSVRLRLRCIERSLYGENDGANFVLDLPITRHIDGVAHTFRMKIPDKAVPAFASLSGSTHWRLDVDVKTRGVERTLLSFPLEIVPEGSSGIDGPSELPLIGDQRRSEMLARIARQSGMILEPSSQRLVGTVEGLPIEIGASSDGHTELRVKWGPLGLGLSVGPSRWNDALSPHEIVIGHEAFDQRYQIRGRERAQVQALLALPRPLLDTLAEARALTMDDESFAVAVADLSNDEPALLRFVHAARAMAAALREPLRQVPVCASIAPSIEAWRALASRYTARLCEADGSLRGAEIGAERLNLAHVFKSSGKDASAVETTIVARLDPALSEPPSPELPASVRAEWKSALEALANEGGRWKCDANELRVEVVPALLDPLAAERWIVRVAHAAKVIQGRRDTGPFR